MPSRKPVYTAQAREDRLIGLAMDAAEEKLLNKTASSQIITHFLDLATVKYQLELERIRSDLKVSDAKIQSMKDQANLAETYENAIRAMQRYSRSSDDNKFIDDLK